MGSFESFKPAWGGGGEAVESLWQETWLSNPRGLARAHTGLVFLNLSFLLIRGVFERCEVVHEPPNKHIVREAYIYVAISPCREISKWPARTPQDLTEELY